jgi:translation initiation factor 2-alpha kinase 4
MCHEIVVAIRTYLESIGTYVQETFYDAMIRKEKEKNSVLQNLRKESDDSHKFMVESKHDFDTKKISSLGANLTSRHKPESSTKDKPNHVNDLPEMDQSFSLAQQNRSLLSMKKKTTDQKAPGVVQPQGKKTLFDELEDLEEESSDSDESSTGVKHPRSTAKGPIYDYTKSRYVQEFEPLQLIGSGASGEVWKVKHKLDQRIYAVKKINLNYRDNSLRQKIQREVTTISSLFHKNIVRYYAAWIEQYEEVLGENILSEKKSPNPQIPSFRTMGDKEKATLTPQIIKSKAGNAWLEGNPFTVEAEKELNQKGYSSSGKEYNDLFESESDESESKEKNSSGLGFKPRYHQYNAFGSSSSSDSSSDSDQSESSSNGSEDSGSDLPSILDESMQDMSGSQKRKSDWLFIQMEYCYTTLRAVIDEKEIWKHFSEVKRLFREMLEALAYVHDRKVIHRDLKVIVYFFTTFSNLYCSFSCL